MLYFDNAATSWPKPRAVAAEVYNCLNGYFGNPGRGAHFMSMASAQKIYDCRCAVAELFGSACPENVVMTYNDTHALNIAIKALAVPGCHIIISNIEHNSVLRPVASLKKLGISYSVYDATLPDEKLIEHIRSLIRDETCLIISNHASNICPLCQPIEKIGALCRRVNASRGYYDTLGDSRKEQSNTVYRKAMHSGEKRKSFPIYFIVDAAQTAGNRKIDIEKCNIDALCAPGHKGLYGPPGSGFVLFGSRAAEKSDRLKTIIEGGSGLASLDIEMPETLPERFEAGSAAFPSVAGLHEGIKFVKKRGEEAIGEHELFLGRHLSEMLQQLNGIKVYLPERYGSIVLFNANGIPSEEMAARLGEKRICVRAGLHCAPLAHRMLGTENGGAVRASIGAFNTKEEVDSFVMAVKDIIEGKSKVIYPKKG